MGVIADLRESWEARRALAHAQRRAEAQIAEIVESLASRAAADLADEDVGWVRLSDGVGSEYSNADLHDMRKRCHQLYEIDPTVAQAVFVLQAGTLGAGVIEPKAVDARVQEVIDAFWNDEDNKLALTSREGLELLHLLLMIEGERFMTLHVAPTDAEVRLADVGAGEITRIITHPENRRRPVLYRREYRPQVYNPAIGRYDGGTERTVEYLLDWRLAPEIAKGKWDNDAPLQELLAQTEAQTRKDAYCYHVRLTVLGLRSAPGIWRAFEWAKAHGKSLSTMLQLASALAMFAWQKKVKTGNADVLKKFAQNLENPYSRHAQGPGAVQVGNEYVDLSPINVGTGGTQVQEATARQMHLQEIRTFGFGEHWYSDATRGNLATAAAMELPAVWRIEDHQALMRQVLANVCAFAVAVAQDRGVLPADVDPAVTFNFPAAQPSTVGETATLLQALTMAAQAGVVDPREASLQAYQALATQDINAVLERQYPGEAKTDGSAPEQVRPTPGLEPQPTTEAEDVREAVVESRPFWKLPAAQTLERQFAVAIQKRVIDPWWRQVREWLKGLDVRELPPSPDAFRQLLEREVPVDRKLYYAVIDEFRLKVANLAGQAALDKIVATARRFVRIGEAFGRVEEIGRRTLAERLQAGEEWNAVAEGYIVFNLRDPQLLRELKQRGTKITGDPTQTMMDELHSVLERKMYREGQGPAVVAAELDGIFPPTYRGRAENIARTEMRIAQGIITHATYEKNGVAQRQWFALLDADTRPEHAAAHGQVRGINEPFDIGGEKLMHPGDPNASIENIARCRCDELPVIGGESSLPAQPWVGGYQPLTEAARVSAAPLR